MFGQYLYCMLGKTTFTVITGGSSGGVAGVATPLNFQKKFVVIITSSNNACLRVLRGIIV